MTKTRFIYLLFLFTLLISSCEKDANIKLPDQEPKLVVACFISPQDTLIKVWVSLSAPIFQNNNNPEEFVSNAMISISDGIITKYPGFNSQEKYYALKASDFPIQAGKTYYLEVTMPDGKKANASTTVPSDVIQNLNASLITTTNDSNSFSYSKKYSIKSDWQDIPGTNYYSFFIERMSITDTSSVDTLFYNPNYYFTLLNDKNNDGAIFKQDYETNFDTYSGAGVSERVVGFNIYVLNVNKEYFDYHNSINNYTPDDPFAEPTLIYSNITGGLGIFAAFQSLKRSIYL